MAEAAAHKKKPKGKKDGTKNQKKTYPSLTLQTGAGTAKKILGSPREVLRHVNI